MPGKKNENSSKSKEKSDNSAGRHMFVFCIFEVIKLLENTRTGYTVKQLHEKLTEFGFNVGERQCSRYIDALKLMNFPLEERGRTPTGGLRYGLKPSDNLGKYFLVNSNELLALFLAKHMLTPLKETPFYHDLERVFQMIESLLPEKSLKFLHEIKEEIQFEPGPLWGLGLTPEIIDTLRSACSERHLVRISYFSVSTSSSKERVLGPQFLYFAKGSLYLIAEEMESGIIKTFSLPRIKEAKMLADEYEGKRVDPDVYFAGSIGIYRAHEIKKVKVRVEWPFSEYVRERKWHRSQRVIARENNVVDLEFDVGITPELVQWVLSMGPSALVIEPEELYDKVMSTARDTAERYEKFKNAG